MSYYLMTGASGLLGNYLMRDLMNEGVRLATIVRPGRRQTARQRIDVLLNDWEEKLGTTLPRPVVLEGDIISPNLGLDEDSIRWVREHCNVMLHNAASLSFHSTGPEGEPYKSNLVGTRNVLEFCKEVGIRDFHHVSTAYVAGKRSGLALETELDLGQDYSNDYERTKCAAEKLVRAADWINPPTIYRPGIIIGDSVTGFTTTYHGFYAAVQLINTIVQALKIDETGLAFGTSVRVALKGDETKHLVPVDWVSQVMSYIMLHPELHANTYHLTPRHPVTTQTLTEVWQLANKFYGVRFIGKDAKMENLTEPEQIFYEHIRVYDSYWRMDPQYDLTNTERAVPHLPCPAVTRELLLKLSCKVIDENFPTPNKKPVETQNDALSVLQRWIDARRNDPGSFSSHDRVGLDVAGEGGGQWQLLFRNKKLIAADLGLPGNGCPIVKTEAPTFLHIARGEMSLDEAIRAGKVCSEQGMPEEQVFQSLMK